MRRIVIVSGGFDPIHIGHIRMIQEAKYLFNADEVVVILNSDKFLENKKGYVFMPYEEREEIVKSIKGVTHVFRCIDKDQTVIKSLKAVKSITERTWGSLGELIFVNGGDRTSDNIPEKETCDKLGIRMMFGIGGGKIQSSSELVKKTKTS